MNKLQPLGTMSSIYLVRHGITPANRESRFAGRTGEELHAQGIEQMRRVGEQLCHKGIEAIYCGPARRTRQSAEILGSVLNIPHLSLAELDEIFIPHWEGLTKDEIRQQYGGQYPAWLSAPQNFSLPGCETLEQVQKRAVDGLQRILSGGQGQKLLLVSHLIVLRCLVLYFQGGKINDFRSIAIGNGSILEVAEAEKGGWALRYLPGIGTGTVSPGRG
jgi:broad specificity phosphatase PhoE